MGILEFLSYSFPTSGHYAGFNMVLRLEFWNEDGRDPDSNLLSDAEPIGQGWGTHCPSDVDGLQFPSASASLVNGQGQWEL